MDITMIDETGKVTEAQLAKIEELLNFAAEQVEVADTTEMSVTFMDNDGIQLINQEYRQKDVPTDVISFALEELGEGERPIIFEEADALPRNLGDIMISIEKAHEQAIEYDHSYERELGFLAVHGFLHLNGYDHLTVDEEKEMFDLQRKILKAYGLKR